MITPATPQERDQLSLGNFTEEEWANLAHDMDNFKLTPATLFSKINPAWIPTEFLLNASVQMASAITQGGGRIIFSMPPRHGKSELSSIALPIWVLENFPRKRIILTTYGSTLSTGFARSVREYFLQDQGILSTNIDKDARRIDHFYTSNGGQMVSVGIGGAVIGKGADVLIIDDYIKTIEESLSENERQKHWDWLMGTAYHRLEPGGTIIIVCTRWHRDDLSGRLLTNFPHEWTHIRYPALAEENDPLGRKEGEALFPQRYPREELLKIRDNIGPVFFNAIYQQDPDSAETRPTDREWINIVDEAPDLRDPNEKVVRVWDFGGGKDEEYDPSVGLLMTINMYTGATTILDVYRKRANSHTTEQNVKLLAITDTRRTEILIEQEPGASGQQLIDHYSRTVLQNFIVQPVRPTNSKLVRAQPFLAACGTGKVSLLRRNWNEEWLKEFAAFPEGEYDDQVDTAAHGYNYITGAIDSTPAWGTEDAQKMKDMDLEQYEKRLEAWRNKLGTAYAADNKPTVTTGAAWGTITKSRAGLSRIVGNKSRPFGANDAKGSRGVVSPPNGRSTLIRSI